MQADRYNFLQEGETFWATPSRAQDAGDKATLSGIIAVVGGRKVFQVEMEDGSTENFKSPSGLCKTCFTRGANMTNEWDGRNHLYVERDGRRISVREAGQMSSETQSQSDDSVSADNESVTVPRRRRLIIPASVEQAPVAVEQAPAQPTPLVIPAPQVTVVNEAGIKWAYAAPLWIIATCALVHTVSISSIRAFFEI